MRPSLTTRQRKGAAIAGIVGFVVLNIGLIPAGILLVLGVFGFAALMFGAAFGGAPQPGDFGSLIAHVISQEFSVSEAAVPGIVIAACIVGAILVVGSIILSIRVLKRHGVNHPAGVTWAGIAIAGVVHEVVVAILLFAGASGSSDASVGGPAFSDLGFALVSLACVAVLDAALGWLAWWWMAHLMRSRTTRVKLEPQVSAAQI
jgi:hypothetical protein